MKGYDKHRVRTWLDCLLGFALMAGSAAAAEVTPRKDMDEQVELAVESGLHWLASCQVSEGMAAGSWAGTKYPTAVSGLAGLAFLANGYTPGSKKYGAVVALLLS